MRCPTRVFPPQVLDEAQRAATAELLFELLPVRKPRSNVRAVKRKMSNFIVKREEHRNPAPPDRTLTVVHPEAVSA